MRESSDPVITPVRIRSSQDPFRSFVSSCRDPIFPASRSEIPREAGFPRWGVGLRGFYFMAILESLDEGGSLLLRSHAI